MANSIPNLVLKGTIYYARYYVPAELQTRRNRKEIWRSLRTSSFSHARDQLKRIVRKMDEDMETLLNNPNAALTEQSIWNTYQPTSFL